MAQAVRPRLAVLGNQLRIAFPAPELANHPFLRALIRNVPLNLADLEHCVAAERAASRSVRTLQLGVLLHPTGLDLGAALERAWHRPVWADALVGSVYHGLLACAAVAASDRSVRAKLLLMELQV
eukprot:TRINITY_DN22769_c0_g1_i1.p2 TRINITY_DN22769_c0_g1~~TRINITY_DN22769_c0_g1_i1.p2  ORF type:complete len:125 (-),score=17.21 TRINITY_DN22769_c0_g1_i1:213-587(-)